jgi:hypothetical protein
VERGIDHHCGFAHLQLAESSLLYSQGVETVTFHVKVFTKKIAEFEFCLLLYINLAIVIIEYHDSLFFQTKVTVFAASVGSLI